MRSSTAIIGIARRLILAVVFAFSVPAAFAQTPPAGNRDDLDVTMRTIGNPDAKDPDEIVRKIPPPKAKKRSQGADDRADDLAQPGESGENEGGSAVDPATGAPSNAMSSDGERLVGAGEVMVRIALRKASGGARIFSSYACRGSGPATMLRRRLKSS